MASPKVEGTSYEDIEKIVEHIKSNYKLKENPKIGIICGSGLGGLAELVKDQTVVPYEQIPHFPRSTVQGHEGSLVFGTLGGKYVVLMKGRTHGYEGYPPQRITIPVRTMALLGVKILLVTNAAGGINKSFKTGDIMIIKDHINMAGFSGFQPLIGPNDERFGPRFPAVSKSYDKELRTLAKQIVKDLDYSDFFQEGVYNFLIGPTYETVAEARYLNMIGADATGMSTVPEVITAVHGGLRVFGMSIITNMVIQDYDTEVTSNHEEVLETSKRQSSLVMKFVDTLVSKISI